MNSLLGEFECKLDAKSRLALPAGLLRQLPAEVEGRFVINRGFERNLTLYPMPEWQRISARVNQLNLFVLKNRQFARRFHRGATELKLDSHNRLLLPRRLLEYAGIQDQLILLGYQFLIELWAEDRYDREFETETEEFAALAEQVMGGPPPQDGSPDARQQTDDPGGDQS